MTGCKPASTPLDASIRLHHDIDSPFPDVTAYRRLVGRLLYLTTTHPDIAFAIQQLSQFMSAPTELHYKSSICVLEYLKRSPSSGIFCPSLLSFRFLALVMHIEEDVLTQGDPSLAIAFSLVNP